MGEMLSKLLSGDSSAAPSVLLAIIIWLLYRQFELHAAERKQWNERYDALSEQQLRVIERNSEAMSSMNSGLAEIAATLRSEVALFPRGTRPAGDERRGGR